jgi:hypothetical protein
MVALRAPGGDTAVAAGVGRLGGRSVVGVATLPVTLSPGRDAGL